MPLRLPMTKEYMFRKRVLRNDVSIIREPRPKYKRSLVHEKLIMGRHADVVHSMRLLAAPVTIVCHTIAHGPAPLRASAMPVTPPSIRPMELETATIRTSMAFIRRLICTMKEALMMIDRVMTRMRGISRMSFWKQRAIKGAQSASTA